MYLSRSLNLDYHLIHHNPIFVNSDRLHINMDYNVNLVSVGCRREYILEDA